VDPPRSGAAPEGRIAPPGEDPCLPIGEDDAMQVILDHGEVR
jgi:hypothetical protein